MARSQVQGNKGGASEVSTTRTSKTGWLRDSFSPTIGRIGRRGSRVTGLNTDTATDDAELLQLSGYMNGGHYNPHHDYVMKEKAPDHVSRTYAGFSILLFIWPQFSHLLLSQFL